MKTECTPLPHQFSVNNWAVSIGQVIEVRNGRHFRVYGSVQKIDRNGSKLPSAPDGLYRVTHACGKPPGETHALLELISRRENL